MNAEQIYTTEGSAASDVRSGPAEINLGEFHRLEGLTPSAKNFLEQNEIAPGQFRRLYHQRKI